MVSRRCPECNGKVVLMDGFPSVKRRYRWLLGCDNDCVAVCGPSRQWCVSEWNRICREKMPPKSANAELRHIADSAASQSNKTTK